ncbi:MAG: hypothetical protein PHO04_03160 [Candidatus Pacebacteria bacterium]|jgi:hypothetical protein|nr:hypothetical protein [Candidatus Paceibacterota bacterium]NMB47591.1 hypothetical protein [Patescibacteria group bacterium]
MFEESTKIKKVSISTDDVLDLKKADIGEVCYSFDFKNIERKDVPIKYKGGNLVKGYLVIKKIL